MTLVSSKEFATKPAKYFSLAQNEQVVIKRGKGMYHLTYTPLPVETYPEQPILEPDENLRRAISAEEFQKRCQKVIDKIFDK